MNWRALLQNQWFQLCLLVAVLSGGVMIYNIAQKPGSDIVGGTERRRQALHLRQVFRGGQSRK